MGGTQGWKARAIEQRTRAETLNKRLQATERRLKWYQDKDQGIKDIFREFEEEDKAQAQAEATRKGKERVVPRVPE